jgi:hypothetical protein
MNDDRFWSRPTRGLARMGATVLAVAVMVAAVLGGQALLGAVDVGLGADNWIHATKTKEWLNSGWYMFGYELEDGEPLADASPYVYGPAFSALAHLANVAVGIEGMGELAESADAYAVRHVVIALLALATVVCVAIAVWTLTRDRIAAVWSGAALLAIPAWTGHAMFAIKDVPVAFGYTCVTVGLVVALASIRAGGWPLTSRRMLGSAGLIAVGALLGAGTRPALWVPFGISLAAFAALSWAVVRSRRATTRALALPAAGFALGSAAPWRSIPAFRMTRSDGWSTPCRIPARPAARAWRH